MEEKSCLLQLTGNPILLKNERKEREETEKGKTRTKTGIKEVHDTTNATFSSEAKEKEDQENKQLLSLKPETCVQGQEGNRANSGNRVTFARESPLKKWYEGEEVKETDGMAEENTREGEEGKIERRDTLLVVENATVPDGGWGWVVLAGSFVVMLLISSVGPCFSIVFSPLLLDLGTSPSTIFWIISTFSLVWNLASPTVGPLTQEFGYRSVAMVGSLLLTFSIILSAFATSSWFLFLFFSLVGGLGAGVVVTISNLIIPVYFTKRLGRANGILMTGTSLGLFTAPHLITFLQERYTYLGATLILGGIFLNTCISALVFHPVWWHVKNSGCEEKCSCIKEIQLQQSEADVARCVKCERKASIAVGRATLQPKSNQNSENIFSLLFRVCRSTVLSLRILYSPPALIIALSSTLTMNGYLGFLIMVPFVVKILHSVQGAALCLSVAGACNLVSRLVVSALTDCKWFDMRIGYIVGLSIITLTDLAFPFLTSLRWMVVVMGMWGCGAGTFMGLYNLVMIKYMGIKSLPSMFGAASLLNGLGFITIGPLLGWISEATGSYAISMWVLAFTQCICIILWLFMPAAMAWQNRSPVTTSCDPV